MQVKLLYYPLNCTVDRWAGKSWKIADANPDDMNLTLCYAGTKFNALVRAWDRAWSIPLFVLFHEVFQIKNRHQNKGLCLSFLLSIIAISAHAGTLTLPEAITEALHTQPYITQASHTAAASQDMARATHAALLPQVSLVAGSIWSESRDAQPLFVSANGSREVIAQLRVSLPLYDPQLNALAKVAKDQSAVAQSQAQATRLSVVATVVNDYYRLAVLLTQQTIWHSTLHTTQKLYGDTQKAYRAGAVSRLDLVQTSLLRNKARTGLQQSTAEAQAAMRILNLQIGRAANGALVLPPFTASKPTLPPSHVLYGQAQRTQPLLRVAEQQIRVGQGQVSVQNGAILPTISANGAYGVDTSAVPRGNDLGWQGSVTMRLPIFGFGIRRQRIAAAQEQVAALQAARQALILQIKSQIALDYGVAQAADKTLVNARRAAHDAQRVYVMTRKGYFAGALNALNLAQAEGSWVRARLRLANAEVAVHLTQAQLDLDIGQYPTANTGIAPA